jgi:hypothetical protein
LTSQISKVTKSFTLGSCLGFTSSTVSYKN